MIRSLQMHRKETRATDTSRIINTNMRKDVRNVKGNQYRANFYLGDTEYTFYQLTRKMGNGREQQRRDKTFAQTKTRDTNISCNVVLDFNASRRRTKNPSDPLFATNSSLSYPQHCVRQRNDSIAATCSDRQMIEIDENSGINLHERDI